MVAKKPPKLAPGEMRASTHGGWERANQADTQRRAAEMAARRASQTPGPRIEVRPNTSTRIDGTKGRLDNGPSPAGSMGLPTRSNPKPMRKGRPR